jgi:DNA-binding CsgD family transcriptional regulator
MEVTEKEREILEHLASGLTGKEIADRLSQSRRTVIKRIERLRLKLGCKNVNQLIHITTKHNLV